MRDASMDSMVFNLGLLGAGVAFLGVIALSVIGGLLEKSVKSEEERKRLGKTSMIIAFTLFIAICFSVVPVFVGLFVSMLPDAVAADTSIIAENEMLIVFAFWAVIIIGLAIALPSMKKGDFFGGA